MPTIKIAHLREQGQDIIIVPLDRRFDFASDRDQQATVREIRIAAASAGLAGTVAVIWKSGSRMKFIAPLPWHQFFRRIDIDHVYRNLNRSLSW